MNIPDLEKSLRIHADRVKEAITPPFNMERKEFKMTKPKNKIKKTLLIAAAIVCILGTTVFAAHYYLLPPAEIAMRTGYTELADLFSEDDTQFDLPPQQSGEYTIQLFGIASGKNLSGFVNVNEDRSYIVGAISRTDGGKLTDYPGLQLSPLIAGYAPWRINIFTLQGGKSEFINEENTVDYFVYECDSLEIFADRTVYIAVYEGLAPSREIFNFNTDGTISFNESYAGTKALFEVPLDKSKADPEKAAAYLEAFNENIAVWHRHDNVSEETEKPVLETE